MTSKESISVFWHRRDLRIFDNVGLYHSLQESNKVLPIFIYDTDIINSLSKHDARLHFINERIKYLYESYSKFGGGISTFTGKPIDVFKKLIEEFNIGAVYTNKDYEPYAKERDLEIEKFCKENSIHFKSYKDQVIFEASEIKTDTDKVYSVYTPYSRKWITKFEDSKIEVVNTEKYLSNKLYPINTNPLSLEEIGFQKSVISFPKENTSDEIIKNYKEKRDYPGIEGTSRLGIHLRFGTISIRELAKKAIGISETFLKELVWREFYMMLLDSFPHIAHTSYKKEYENIEWRNSIDEFEAWKNGQTGYPIVDAGMRQLNTTGYMHNRVRMITASFLVKHLLIDWKWGERYFAEKLLDFELASNVGGWQWAAGSGFDAAPYFRIFNPTTQSEKFDSKALYIRQYVKEIGTFNYPKHIVEHKFARNRCLDAFNKALKK